VTIQAEGGGVLYDRGVGTAAFDWQDVILGQESMYYNGALRMVRGTGAFVGGYDANGSMTKRVVDGGGWIMTYDAENHMTQAQSSTATATFVYDGDGRRVQGTVGGVTTAYIGNYYEWTGSTSTMVRCYYAGATRVAMRVGSILRFTLDRLLYYLLSDQLGSTTITADANAAEYSELRYKAWGETRYSSGSPVPTKRQFTGELLESSLGLYFYGARFYDSALGRFVSADTIVPGMGNPQSWDRYSYVRNNPVDCS
jgi:RHS repeat-associated protein